MGITNSNKVINMERIDCDGSLKVTLALTAAPDIVTNPTDIALVLDRSGSLTGEPLASMKTGAKTFIDIISESTGGQASGEIGSGSRIGIVSFSSTSMLVPPCRYTAVLKKGVKKKALTKHVFFHRALWDFK